MCTPAHFFAPHRGNLYCHDLCFRFLNQISLLVSLPLAAVLPRRLRPFHTHVRFKQCSVFVVIIVVCRFSTSAYNNLQQHGQKPNGVMSNSLSSTSAIVRHSPSATICTRRLPWGHPSFEHNTLPTLVTISHSHIFTTCDQDSSRFACSNHAWARAVGTPANGTPVGPAWPASLPRRSN